MKAKIILISFSLSLLSFGFAQQSPAPGEVVEKCINALGGAKGIGNFSDFKAEGEEHRSFGTREFTGKIKIIQTGRKVWQQTVMSFGTREYKVIRAFDGTTAWRDARGNVVDSPSLSYLSDADHTPALLLEKQAAFTIAGQEEIEGKKTFRLEVDFKGKKTTFFIDQTDCTILEIAFKDLYFGSNLTRETIEKQTRFSDYRKKGDTLFPFKWVFYKEKKKTREVCYSEVTFTPGDSPELFRRPDRELDFRYREEKYH